MQVNSDNAIFSDILYLGDLSNAYPENCIVNLLPIWLQIFWYL